MKGFKMTFDKNILQNIKFCPYETLSYANELFNAIDDFYKTVDEHEYFTEVEGRERGIVFRIAHILANKIEEKGVYVDCEANRCNGHSKIMPSNNILQKLIKTEFITPDLIIHKRNGKSRNWIISFNKRQWRYNNGCKFIKPTKNIIK